MNRIARAWAQVLAAATPRLPALQAVPLYMDAAAYRAPRNYAFCVGDRHPEIHIAPEAADLDEDTLLGILWHEAMHAAQQLYRLIDERTGRRWKGSGDSEQRTDDLAHRLFGVRIEYDPTTWLQCLDCPAGVWPRPKGLR